MTFLAYEIVPVDDGTALEETGVTVMVEYITVGTQVPEDIISEGIGENQYFGDSLMVMVERMAVGEVTTAADDLMVVGTTTTAVLLELE